MVCPRSVFRPGTIALMLLVGGLGTAHAKQSHFTVHNCSKDAFDVKVYDGDDTVTGDLKAPRATHHLTPNETKKMSCKVSSGKKRCLYEIWRKGENASKNEDRVNDGTDIYVTRVYWCTPTNSVLCREYNTTGCNDAPTSSP